MREKLLFRSAFRLLFLLMWLIPCKSVGVPFFVSGNDSLTLRYIEKPDTLFVVRASLSNEVDYFEVSGPGFRYDVRPNVRIAQKIGLAYRFISFSYSFYAPVFAENNDNDRKGKTKSFSAGMNFLGNHWSQSLQLSKTKGYYLENTQELVPGWNPDIDPYITLPDQLVYRLAGITSYKFNPRLSLKAFATQTEIQRKSAGTFLAALHYTYLSVDNRSKNSSQQSSQKSVQTGAQLLAGYTHTFVAFHRWYLSAGISAGGGFNYTDLLTRYPEGNISNHYTDPVFRMDAQLSAGYNSSRLFFGIQSVSTISSENQNRSGVTIAENRVFAQLFLGYRFNTPPLLKKAVGKAEQIIPFSKP